VVQETREGAGSSERKTFGGFNPLAWFKEKGTVSQLTGSKRLKSGLRTATSMWEGEYWSQRLSQSRAMWIMAGWVEDPGWRGGQDEFQIGKRFERGRKGGGGGGKV